MGPQLAAAALAVALAAAAALWPRGKEPRALIVDRDADEAQVFLRLPAEAVLEALRAAPEGVRLAAEVTTPGGRLDTVRVQALKVEILDALLPRLALEVGGVPAALEPMGLLAHPAADAGAFEGPLDAWRAIGACLAPEAAPTPRVEDAVVDLGVVAWPIDGAAPIGLAVDLPGPFAAAAFAEGRPLPHEAGPEGWRVPGLAP